MTKKPNDAVEVELLMNQTVKSLALSLIILSCVLISGCEESPKPVATWQHAAVGMLDASLSDDGRYALVSSVNHQAGYWDLQANELLFQWRHNDNPEDGIIATDISPDGTRAITADNRTFVIWNTSNGQAYGYWEAPAQIAAVAISDKGRFVLLGLRNGKVIHISMETGRRLEFTAHRVEPIASVDLSPNGLWAFSGASDGRAILWNTQTAQPRFIFEHDTRVTLVRLQRQGQLAFTAGTRGNAILWDLSNGTEITRLQLKPREYVTTAVAFSADGSKLVTGAPDRDIVLWSTRNGAKLAAWQAKTREVSRPVGAIVWAVAFDKDGQHIVTEASSGYGQKWRIPELNPSGAPL